jgi:ubiquitin carboxyl-terminal hydrolase 5/13
VLPRVPLEACLVRWAAEEALTDYHSAVLGRKTRASKRQRLANFPPFLLIQLKRCDLLLSWGCQEASKIDT